MSEVNHNEEKKQSSLENEQKEKLYYKRVLRNYVIICIVLIACSFVGLFFNEWILPISFTICSLLGVCVTFLLLKTHSDVNSESGKGSFAIYMLLRYACMTIGIVSSCLLVKFTMGEDVNKLRYLLVLASSIPFFATAVTLLLTKQVE